MSTNNIKIFFLLIMLSFESVRSFIPVGRYAQSSVLVDKRIYFFGGESFNSPKTSTELNRIIYLDVSKPFNTENPPFQRSPVLIPFGSSFATALYDSQKNIIYLFGGVMVDVNTGADNYKSVLNSYNLETNEWYMPKTNGIEPQRRREMSGVIDNTTGKFYVFGGSNYLFEAQSNLFNDMNIFDTVSLTWTKGSTINAPFPRVDYTATLLPNGIIVFIGGRENYSAISLRDVNMSQLSLYDTKADKWLLMTAQGDPVENRNCHSAVLTSDGKIIIFGGRKNREDNGLSVENQLAVLNTQIYPYEWSIPPVTATTPPPTLSLHSATLVGNYMFVNFGNNTFPMPIQNPQVRVTFFYILDTRNFTWVTQYEPEVPPTNSPQTNSLPTSSSPAKKVGIIIGVTGSGVISIIAGFFVHKVYKLYKIRKYQHNIPHCCE